MLDLQKGCLDLQIIKTPKELNDWAKKNKVNGKTIGLVPTMGYLHEGHKSLIQKSSSQNDLTVVSVFVNPCLLYTSDAADE